MNNETLFKNILSALSIIDRESFWNLTIQLEPSKLYHFLNDHLDLFTSFVNNCADDYKHQCVSIGKYPFACFCIYGEANHEKYRSKLQRHFYSMSLFSKAAKSIQDHEVTHFKENIDLHLNEWTLGETVNGAIRRYNLDFTSLPFDIRDDIKCYLKYLVESGKQRSKIQSCYAYLRDFYNELISVRKNQVGLLDVTYFDVQQVFKSLQQKKNIAFGTIRLMFTAFKGLLNWVIDKYEPGKSNPFDKFVFRNVQSHSNSTPYINDSIFDSIENNKGQLPPMVSRIWTIMTNTGMRISEVLNLQDDCLRFDDVNRIYILKYHPTKNAAARLQKGLNSGHEVPVPAVVSDAIREQINETTELRSESSLREIFVHQKGINTCVLSAKTITENINKLSKRLGLKYDDGTDFVYHNHMCRKTFVVDMIEKGHTIDQIADYINHLSTATTEKYYRDIKLDTIAKLDSQMFDQLFEETIQDSVKSQFSPEEKQALVREIKLGSRTTPEGHGFCVKHVAFGPCQKKKCVGCKMLVTGPQKLPMWYKLYKEQQDHLSELESEYTLNGVEDFKEHRLYQQETSLLAIYQDTIQKVEKFAEKAGISIEEYLEQ